MPATQSRLKKFLLAVQNLLGLHICIRRKPSKADESDEKLLNIFNNLTVGISEVFDDKPRTFDEYLRCDKVSCKISVLSEQIAQVRMLYSLWKNGYDLNHQDLISKLQSLNLLVDCIRDDVFYAYLRLPPEEKLQLLKKNKQVSAIFAVLGTLENEVSGMMKTMQPDEELMKTVKPLLKPNFNRVIYKRQPKKSDGFDPPSYNSLQFSCRKITYKRPSLVDVGTDPIGRVSWDMHDLDTKVNTLEPKINDLEPVHPSRHTKDHPVRDAAVQVSLNDAAAYFAGVSNHIDVLVEETAALAEFRSQDRVSVERLSIFTNDTDKATCAEGAKFHFSSIQDRSRDPEDHLNIELEHDLSIWKMAANLIVDHPVRI